MNTKNAKTDSLIREVRELRRQLAEADSIIDAIRGGEVDAVLVSGSQGDDVYVLSGADRMYRAIVEEMQEGYLTLVASGTILFCNKNFSEMVRKPQESVIGMSIYGLVQNQQDRARIQSCLANLQKGFKTELNLKAHDGVCVPVLAAASNINIDGEVFFCLVVTNLSELKHNERMTSMVFDQSTEAIVVCDRAGRVLRANAAAAALLGENIVGCEFDGNVKLYDEKTDGGFPVQKVAGLADVKGVEVRFPAKDEKEYSLLLSAGRLYDDDKTDFFGYVITLTNITELKEYSREISRLDRLNLIGEMAAGIGHEVRNPLTTVRGYLQMYRDKPHYPKSRESLDLIIEELDRANLIISEFLSLGKNKADKLKSISLKKTVEHIYPLIQADALRRGSEVQLGLSETPNVNADEKEIRQCLLNLVRNSFEAMPKGGIVRINTFCTDKEVILAVSDDGPGIPPQIKAKLGTPFISTKDNGTGLGLPVCYSIANRHGARIDVDSGSGGTTFSLVFNLAGDKLGS